MATYPRHLLCFTLCVFSSLPVHAAAAEQALDAVPSGPGAPVKIFFDTDMMTDCDDAGALAILHALADAGECEILATVVSSADPWSAATVDAINRYYLRPELRVGMVKDGGVREKSKYTRRIGEDFPNGCRQAEAIPDALAIYRDVLQPQPDGSVVVVTVGYLTNLRNLLRQPAGDGHPSGADLIRRKVRKWVCMGGNFIGHPPRDDLRLGNVNFQRDAASAVEVIRNWPTPVVFAGREVCSVPSGLKIGASLARTPPENPVRRAYELYFDGQARDRHVADLAAVLYAVRGRRDCWDLSEPGRMDIQEDCTFTWHFDQAGLQSYLLKKPHGGQPNDRHVESVLEELLLRPPRPVDRE